MKKSPGIGPQTKKTFVSLNSFLKKFKDYFVVGLDIPLLYETGMDKGCDYIFLVHTTKKIQKKRVLKWPNMTEKKFELINNS